MIKIKQNALFIADSHYPHHKDTFLTLLQKIKTKEIITSQLFLMGDNFDLLFGYNEYIKTFSNEAIALINDLSTLIEVIYLEGNHDFCLKEIFPKVKVYSREQQPIFCELGNKKVALSHGDRYVTGLGYNFYSKILRNKITLNLLKPFEKKIIDSQMQKLSQKKICHTFVGFEKRVEQILKYYRGVDMVIEGHFHQAKIIQNYYSLPSLACQGKVGVVKGDEIEFVSL